MAVICQPEAGVANSIRRGNMRELLGLYAPAREYKCYAYFIYNSRISTVGVRWKPAEHADMQRDTASRKCS